MEKKLALKDYLYLGSMLFGLFFGAGNLIFPIHLGQLAGENVWPAILGFLITGIGLPLLGVIAIGVSSQRGILEVSKRVHPLYGLIFTLLLYLVIGPFFALPRLASTSFEIALAPFLPTESHRIALFIFSFAFFILAGIFSLRPAKLLEYVGKVLNPLFLILLFILIGFAFFRPLGDFTTPTPQASYATAPFVTGLKEGYNTLDALASLAFGIIVVTTLQQMGVKKNITIAKDTVKSGLVSVAIMGVIYTCLALMGTMSLGKFSLAENGGVTLAEIAHYYLGNFGSLLMALMVIIACFKTAIGLITAFSETFAEILPQVSYHKWMWLAVFLPACIANFGLTKIINAAVPLLMFLYPLAVTLILLVLTSSLFHHKRMVYQSVTFFTFFAGLLEGLNALPSSIKSWPVFESILQVAKHLPLFSLGMSWILFAAVGFLVGYILSFRYSKKFFLE